MSELRAMPWIGEHSVLDVANTIAVGAGSGRTDVDLFTVPELLERWRQAALDRGVAALPVARLAELRELVGAVLDHLDRHVPLTAQLRADLNALVAAAPVVLALDGDAQLTYRPLGGDAGATLGRDVIGLLTGADRERVRRCRASGCGMFFLARRRDQTWCSIGCGNRVRAQRQQAARIR